MADTVHYCPFCNRHSCFVAVPVEDKCEAAQIADAADEMVRLRLALETATRERDEARAEVARHVRERALLMNWATDKDGTGCDGCHGTTAGDQDLMLLCQSCGETARAALAQKEGEK